VIIKPVSLLDNDFYKFTMQYAAMQMFSRAQARYAFINRGEHIFPEGFAEVLKASVEAMQTVKLTLQEKEFLRTTCPYLSPVYLDFLQGYSYDPVEVHIEQNSGSLNVTVEGFWYRSILWEVPLLYLISELYYKTQHLQRNNDEEVYENTKKKIDAYNERGITIAEFGTRRRHSYAVHKIVMNALTEHKGKSFIGSSNVHMAMINSVKPIGTHAHEWFMFHAAKYGFKMANATALEHWTDVYRGDLGIALSDTYTTPVFFNQFDKKFAKLFDGVRHDSGDPVSFAAQTIAHYEKLGINPLSKTIIFSDGLNYEKVNRIAAWCKGKIGCSFGVGTNFTNDVGLKAMNIVIKLTGTQPGNDTWIPTIKLSDEPGKYTGDKNMIALSKQILHIAD
jgi:nicotinate phosphoribosyltransferase